MGQRRTPGLYKRGDTWHIDKRCKWAPTGRLCESTGASSLAEAEAYLARRLSELEAAAVHGKRLEHPFEEAAARFLDEYPHLASIDTLAEHLEQLIPFIGRLPVDQVDDEALQPFVRHELARGRRPKTINNKLGVVHRVLTLCARKWRDKVAGRKIPWLGEVPMIERLPVHAGNSAQPYPLGWDEQERLLAVLPAHLQDMTLYKVNVGCREQEVCHLRWEWEVAVPELDTTIFLVPGWVVEDGKAEGLVKNRQDRLHILNRVARSVIEERRRQRPVRHLEGCGAHRGKACNCAYGVVFTYKGYAMAKMHTSGWQRAWKAAGLPDGREFTKGVHNLKHTCGRRLRAAGVPRETRQVILGHSNGHITTHYSAGEIAEVLDAVERIAVRPDRQAPTLTVLKARRVPQNSRTDSGQRKTG